MPGWPYRTAARILFVDDETSLRQIAADMLAELGYDVTLAGDGQEALDLLQRDPGAFDLLITDATMSRMAGAALIEAVRGLAPSLPAILCSGQGELMPGHRPAGVRFLAKPVTMAELATAIRATLATASPAPGPSGRQCRPGP